MGEVAEVEKHGGTVLRDGVEYRGWRFEGKQGPILSGDERAALQAKFASEMGPAVPSARLWPEAIFGHSHVTVSHLASGLRIDFGTDDALASWLAGSLAHGSRGVKVAAAKMGTWEEKRATLGADREAAADYDWTFQTECMGSVTDGAVWTPHRGDGIDWSMLRRRDPILHFVDMPLYTDDLADNGECEVRLRLRVMPGCFFALLRCHIRVDGALVKQRDLRVRRQRGATSRLPSTRRAMPPPPPLPTRRKRTSGPRP